MATVVTDADADTPALGGLFAGISFFLVQRFPSRSTYVSRIQANGGRVVKLEAQADHVIADHLRKDCPPGSLSYRFIDAALNGGALPDPDEHPAGAPHGTVRDVGSVVPGRTTRTPFTAEDDRILWQWVERLRQQGGSMKGNEIYKQLEAKNPRHPFQAWRDRYVKRLMHKPPAGVEVQVPANPPPSPPVAPDEVTPRATFRQPAGAVPPQTDGTAEEPAEQEEDDVKVEQETTEEGLALLLRQAEDIEAIPPDRIDEAFSHWASVHVRHSAGDWRAMYEAQVQPKYLEQRAARKRKRRIKRESQDMAGDAHSVSMTTVDDDDDDESETLGSTQKKARRSTKVEILAPSSQKGIKETPSMIEEAASPAKKLKASPPKTSTSVQAEDDRGDVRESRPPSHQATSETAIEVISLSSGDDEEQEVAVKEEKMFPENDGADEEPTVPDQTDADDLMADIDNLSASDPPTSDNNRAADLQIRRESLEQGEADEAPHELSVLPVPDANIAANVHVRRSPEERGNEDDPLQSTSVFFFTSDANRAAEDQLRRESFGQDDDHEIVDAQDDSHPPTYDAHATTDQQMAEDLPSPQDDNFVLLENPHDVHRGQDMLEEGTEVFIEQPEPSADGLALTEANLASQQALHREQPVRGVDIQEDNENQDQTDFAQYLQNIMGPGPEPSTNAHGAPDLQANDALDQTQYTTNEGFLPSSIHVNTTLAPELPMSSQSEVDDVLQTNLEWPSSPQQARRTHVQSDSFAFETQIEYPGVHFGYGSRSRQAMEPDSPLFQSQTVTYPILPEVQPEEQLNENSYVHVEHEDAPAEMAEPNDEDQDELDLSLPEPEGGWEISSPVEQPVASQPPPDVADNDEDDENTALNSEQPGTGKTILEISSAVASSPLSQSSGVPAFHFPKPAFGQGSILLSTQDILDAETQQPDFHMPMPPDTDDDAELPADPLQSLRPPTSSSAAISQSQQPVDLSQTQTLSTHNDDIDTYITTMNVRRGYSEASIIRALKVSSLRPELAELVLSEEKAGRGVPKDVAGVWDEVEDAVIEGGDAAKMRRVEEKHGWDELVARLEFLRSWREAEG